MSASAANISYYLSIISISYNILQICRYKCPKCRAPFCCVQCSKDHKANHCPAIKSTTSDAQSTATSNNNSSTIAVEQSKYLPSNELISITQPKRKCIRRRNCEDSDSDNDEPGCK